MTAKTMKEAINKINLDNEFYFDEGCHIIELSNSEDDPDVSIVRARVEPDVSTHWHKLKDTIERYVIIEGNGRVEIEELPPTEVSAGDVVLIPAQCRQRITNIGDNDLIFLAICTPRFTVAAYEDIEDAH